MIAHSLALVTGAAHRLGQIFALALARRGYAIGLHFHASRPDVSIEKIREIGVPVYALQADLTKPDQVAELFDEIDMLPHTLGVLVNSAAIMPRSDLRTVSDIEWSAVMDLNLRAPLLCSQHAARRMDSGLIVNISDVGAQKNWTGFPAYVVSKSALETLTRLLAKTLAPGIRVNAIAPGLVLPSDSISTDEWDNLVKRQPFARPATVAEISSALEFLLDNTYVTGQTITVDGGYSLL